jgi:hypothetical protein
MAPTTPGPTLAITPPRDISQVFLGGGTIGSLRVQDIRIGAAPRRPTGCRTRG